MNNAFFLAYDTHQNSGDFASTPARREECSCNGWDTHHCLHFSSLDEREAELTRLLYMAEAEAERRQQAMLN